MYWGRDYAMRMRRLEIVAGVVLVAVVGIGLWFATMPYPIRLWWEASFSDRYSNTWPISRPDFARVECLVKEELGWREIITDVAVPGPDEVRIRTTSRRSVEGQAGHRFIVRKVNGEWAIVKRTACASLFGIT